MKKYIYNKEFLKKKMIKEKKKLPLTSQKLKSSISKELMSEM